MMMKKGWLVLVGLMVSGMASAHGQVVPPVYFMENFIHPFHGLDHLLVMFAVGVWATRQSDLKQILLLPLVFVLSIPGGLLLVESGVPGTWAEPLVLATMLVLGMQLLLDSRLNFSVTLLCAALMGAVHGQSHLGDQGVSSLLPLIGMMSGSLLLHTIGVISGLVARHRRWTGMGRITGTGLLVAAGGLVAGFI